MKFFSRFSDHTKYRILEIIPGALIWLTFAAGIILSFVKPLWVIYFIIIFDFYWLIKIIYLLLYLGISFRRYRETSRINWWKKLQTEIPRYQKLYHLIMLPTYNENETVIRGTLEGLSRVEYDTKKMIVVYALEERNKHNSLPIAERMKKQFAHHFDDFLITIHPANIPGEVKGKGSNIHHAGKQAQKLIDDRKIAYEDVILSSFDIDTVVHPQYFAYLTHTFLTHPKPTRTSYQPVPLFNNNIWDAPALMRIASMGTTFWLMTEQLRPERLFTFSSHSMSFKAVVDVGFHQNDIITEDSRIFLQCFLKYDGDYTVTPLYMPVSMDTVMSDNWWKSLKNLYKQQRRWAWGTEHFPYMVWNFHKNKKIPWRKKIRYLWNQAEGVYSWATAPIMITLLGRLPLYLISEEEKKLAIVQNSPFILSMLMNIALVGLAFGSILSILLLPAPPSRRHKIRWPVMLVQWILFPVTMILFGSIPATDAQTRLMLGKYLGFHVTEKARK